MIVNLINVFRKALFASKPAGKYDARLPLNSGWANQLEFSTLQLGI